MRKVLEALRLLFDHDRSQREIATSLGLSQSTLHTYVRRFQASGIAWPHPQHSTRPRSKRGSSPAARFRRP